MMADVIRVNVDELCGHFENLEDPRSEINRVYPLVSVVVIGLMGVLAGAKGPTGIAEWASTKEDFLKDSLPLPDGVPKKDVFRRVLSCLNPNAFQACFASWLQSLRSDAETAGNVDQPIFAVDGKTLRRSHDNKNGLKALHSVSLWATEAGLTLAQVATDEKSNEITAIPELLRLVDINGAIITIDAMGTQKAIAEEIIDGGGDFIFQLKGNQENLHKAVIDYFDKQFAAHFEGIDARQHVTFDKGHGREETRTYIHMPAPSSLPNFDQWKGLKSIGVVISSCIRDGHESSDIRYYISSLAVGVKRFARAVRGHWGIENSCHWTLDMTYREDESRIRGDYIRQNCAWLNRFTLSLLKQHQGKQSIAMKRQKCGWNEKFLMEVLTGSGT